ncbi:phospholipase D family protein [Halomonas huangheensis]|uniref:PLD phosphodiesterase domain-containing protein n=1 Tax=Halomonas huangheensis TaxID=1178482 RepID=W1N8R3_9GAMM|nr:phospholipase D family protein [Halomonas huangheensis]ERL51596.1 hypothetical protein BJB45_13145 [Halomonas huangheensis]
MSDSICGRVLRQMRLSALLLLVTLLTACTNLPPLEGRSTTYAMPEPLTRDTRLGRVISPVVQKHSGESGIYALRDSRDAFAARWLLAAAAESTLDIQYYIWNDDVTGTMLYKALLDAADRHVRVRLLLDDINTDGRDEKIAALDAHPYIEVRLFNPFVVRSPRWIGYITDFSRANRRMHNKSFTVDNQATVIGGRNIADEYFGASENTAFADLDVLAVGPVVQDVSMDFDRYWSSASSYPATRVLDSVGPAGLERFQHEVNAAMESPVTLEYRQAITNSRIMHALEEGHLELVWANTTMVSDDPAKGLGRAKDNELLTDHLVEVIGQPQESVHLVSPYFVPVERGTRMFTDMEQRGVEVTVLTNALEATDVAAVHAGYAKRRRELLEGGVRLFELKRAPGAPGRSKEAGPLGSSGVSLHAKTFAVDNDKLFVGSFNFDPRSAQLNTELGFIIESPELAGTLTDVFNTDVIANAYEVKLDDDGDMYWLERTDQGVIRYDQEPNSGLLRRGVVSFVSLLPVEWML